MAVIMASDDPYGILGGIKLQDIQFPPAHKTIYQDVQVGVCPYCICQMRVKGFEWICPSCGRISEEVYRQRTRGGGRNADCSGGGRIRAANVTLYLGALSRRPHRSCLGGAVVRVLDT